MEELTAVVSCSPTPQPVLPDTRATDMKLRLKENVTYIVAGVVIQEDKVLLIQEAKLSCRGAWYLPAGRMEKNESIVEAVKREVLEESGFEFEPEALIAVESHGHLWVRFTLTGRVVGGSIKTTEQADKESLQAGWFSADIKKLSREVELRAGDILPLIRTADEWFKKPVYYGLPVPVGHVSSSQRMVLVHEARAELSVLVGKELGGSTRLPVCLFGGYMLSDNSVKTLKEIGYSGGYKDCGVLSVEHLGKPHGKYDGFCVTHLYQADSLELNSSDFQWTVVPEPLATRLRTSMSIGGSASFFRL